MTRHHQTHHYAREHGDAAAPWILPAIIMVLGALVVGATAGCMYFAAVHPAWFGL